MVAAPIARTIIKKLSTNRYSFQFPGSRAKTIDITENTGVSNLLNIPTNKKLMNKYFNDPSIGNIKDLGFTKLNPETARRGLLNIKSIARVDPQFAKKYGIKLNPLRESFSKYGFFDQKPLKLSNQEIQKYFKNYDKKSITTIARELSKGDFKSGLFLNKLSQLRRLRDASATVKQIEPKNNLFKNFNMDEALRGSLPKGAGVGKNSAEEYLAKMSPIIDEIGKTNPKLAGSLKENYLANVLPRRVLNIDKVNKTLPYVRTTEEGGVSVLAPSISHTQGATIASKLKDPEALNKIKLQTNKFNHEILSQGNSKLGLSVDHNTNRIISQAKAALDKGDMRSVRANVREVNKIYDDLLLQYPLLKRGQLPKYRIGKNGTIKETNLSPAYDITTANPISRVPRGTDPEIPSQSLYKSFKDYFYNVAAVADDIDVNKIAQNARKQGFGEPTGFLNIVKNIQKGNTTQANDLIRQATNSAQNNKVFLKDGGRVKKFMGGYINPEDIEAEIDIAEQTDGEILSQKEAIERIVERFTNNFKEGGLAREKFQVGGAVGGGIGGGISGGISGGVGNSKVGNIQAVLAGIAAGVIDIPKGAFSLGASLMDLGLGTSTAAKVESFFDNLTSFDEIAEQRTAGQIARIITNLGIPGSQAWKVGTGLAKKAMFSRNAGKYFKASDPKMAPKIDDALKANGRLYATLGGAAGIGVADAIFVGDPERVGTLGDAFDFGPTQLKPNDENNAAREVMNRLKFGLDSSLLLGLVGGSGSAIKSMVKRRNDLESNNDFIDKILSKIRPRGDKPGEFFRLERESIGIRAGDVNRAQEISRSVDRHIDGMFPFLKPMYEKATIKSRADLMKTLNDTLLSGKTEFTPIGTVAFGQMDDKLIKVATEKMKALGAKPEAMKGIFNSFDEIRSEWGDMFTKLGGRMDETSYGKFSDAFGKKMNDYLSTTYDVFRNKSLLPFLNFKAGEESVDKLANLFIKTAKEKGEDLTKEQARHYVDNIVESAKPGGRGLPLGEDTTAGVFFSGAGNKYFKELVDKSILGDIEFNPKYIQLNTLKPQAKEAINEVLGKIEDPIQTILAGTQKLSLITRRNEFFDELLQSSKQAQEAGSKGFFYTNEADAFAAFGKNIKRIDFDPSKTLEAGVTNPLNGLYAQTGVANALEETSKSILDRLGKGSFAQAYQNFILYPKATSQLAKTVLSPITHVRNLFSASAFAAANGLLPGFIAPDDIIKNMKSAYGKLQFGKAADPVANKEYRKLLRLGVVNSNVTLGDLSRLLEDVKFGENITAASGVKGLMRQFSKIKKGATDLYTAEDDLWKIYTFATERGRFEKAFKRAGITKSADELDEMAADIVRNNVPNYDYVSDFVKGLRQFPIGNFVSFPAEIMRTSVNIMTRGLKEFNEEAIVNGVKVYPLRNIGLQRLFGFAATTTAIPYALVEGAKAIYDVSGLEMDSLRRFVPEWSKNSTLIPVRGDDGELKYIDFSHANAYDTMIRPVKTLINNVRDGQVENEAISKSILQGVFEATKELGQPFISEAIWTEAATDIIVRGGRTRDGRRLYTEQTPNGEKAMAIVGHLVDSQLPGSIEQFKRFDLAIEPVDIFQSGKFDKYGKQYELSDELLGIVGMRAVKVDPVNSMKFKIADFTRGVSNSRREFTSTLLRGGPVTPEQIVDRYQIANNQLYKVQQELFRDYYAARTLGAKESALDLEFADRVSRISLSAIKNGRFKPFVPSENIIASFGENAKNIGQRNPYLAAKPVIDRITRQFNNLPLVLENFPILPNPFSITQPTLPTSGINTNLPNLNLGLSMPTGTGTTGNTIQKGQTVFGPLDPVFGS